MRMSAVMMSVVVFTICMSVANAEDIGNTHSDVGMEFIHIPAGCFAMGSSEGDADERAVHEVCLKGFFMSKYEVTQAQWQQISRNNPSEFQWMGDQRPVEQVSYNDVKAWIAKLNKTVQNKYALPSEEQWEYACRAGGVHDRYCGEIKGMGLMRIAWFELNNIQRSTHPVGQKVPNDFDLYDMSGNVWEWVEGCGGDSYANIKRAYSEQHKDDCLYHIRRGGSWHGSSWQVRAANRSFDGAKGKDSRTGFRLIKTRHSAPSDRDFRNKTRGIVSP